jgi:integrase
MAYVTEKRGVHYAVIYEGTNPVTRRERRRWHRCNTRPEAERLARQLGTEHDRRNRVGSTMTLGDFLLGHWLPAREPNVSRATYARDVKAVEHYMIGHLGDTPLRRLRPEHIRSLHQQLLAAGGRSGGPLSAKTVANAHQLLRSALDDAVDRGLLPANPAAGVRPPDPRSRPSGRRRAKSWTPTELGAFITGTAESQHSMLFRLTAATGMRRGEILGLRWDDVYFDTGRLEITQALISVDYELVFTRLKTRTSRRNVTLDADTLAQLADWRRHQANQMDAAGVTNEHGLVFTRANGKPLHPHTVSQAFERAQRPLPVSPIRFHDLRHTHASLLLRDRVPIKVVSERLGHANPAFTLTTYQHVIPGMQEDAAATFGQLLANHTTTPVAGAVAA